MWCAECVALRDSLRAALLEVKLAEAVRIASVGAAKMIGDVIGLDGHIDGTSGDVRETLSGGLQGGGAGRGPGSDNPDG